MLLHLFVKVALLLLYLVFLIVLLRLLDLSAWYETGFLATQLVDPLSLSVRKLKLLIESRGLAYEGILEREELIKLAENSGDIANADFSLLERKSVIDAKQQKSEEFTGRAHFLEEVEDKKDSVWLIQVVPGAGLPLLGSSTWKSVIQKVSIFGIRTGIFVCARDIRFCRQKGWSKPFVLLAMPDGHQYKDRVLMRQLSAPAQAPAVVDWVNQQLSSKLMEIEDEKELCDHWLEFKSEEEIQQSVRAVIFTDREKPSIIFSALSMRYSGRIKFGYYRKGSAKCIHFKPDSKTHLLISTSTGVQRYGLRKGEFLNYDALNLYLHTLVPEINDVFIISFVIVNMFCCMDLFLTSGGLAKILLCFFWQLAKLNLLFILLWLPLQWTFQLSVIAPLSNVFWWSIQVLCQTGVAGQLRQDWLLHSQHWGIVCCLFGLYCFVCGWFVKKCRPQSQEDNLSSVDWMRLIFHQWHLFMIRPRNIWQQGGPQISTSLEEGLDLFLERTTPDLWLHPIITGEYVHNLPQWKYGGFRKSQDEKYCFKHLCGSCQESWQKFFCMKTEADRQERFEKSCEEIRQMFTERQSKKEKAEIHGAQGIKDKEFYEVFEDGHNKETKIVEMQPTKGSKVTENSTNLSEEKFCGVCLDLICHIEEGESGKAIVVKEPANLHHQDVGHGITATDIWSEESTQEENHTSGNQYDAWPEEMLKSLECAICLEGYVLGSHLCGLPCGHAFHFDCVKVWLCGGKHCCPTCRWPAFKKKPSKLSKYKE
ncbi:E3 ubiquitin-protein ligase RNF103-like isoform X2 [Apostichopus japonicus]